MLLLARGLLPILLLAACATAPPRGTLYEQLGGHAGVSAIVEEMIFRLVENPRIADHFVDIDLVNLHQRLVEQICFLADGPCRYEGLSMRDAHLGQDISEAEFNALVEDLVDTMEARDVPLAAQNQLLARLAPLRADILHR